MTQLVRQLAKYGAYHRDARNRATHMVGIPMIVLALEVLLSRASVTLGGVGITAAMAVSAAASLFYLRLDARFGLAMAVLLALASWLGACVAALSLGPWLATGLGLFVVGWALQFVGHAWEGRRPAFVDDIVGLLLGPLFVLAELAFRLGLRPEVEQAVARELNMSSRT